MAITLVNPGGLPAVDVYRQVSIASGSKLVFVAGQVAWDADGVTVGEGDLAAQAERCYLNVATALAAAGASFAVDATTSWGQHIYVTGNRPELGDWNPGRALELDPASYPLWKRDVELPAGTSFEYKYLRKDAAGNVTWESGANRTATVNTTKTGLNDTWRN
ncbi:carbohydrate-binding module family 20 domain-containing protein [Streptomyces scabiei]|uniref:carbohydrate-binding module family 20 domain-containing protein n=1 Tax=Streptomyces scabiei TaxID=1930 RepID=UPI0039EE0B84